MAAGMLLTDDAKVLYHGNGRVSSIAVTERGGVRSFHVSGKVEASTAPRTCGCSACSAIWRR